MAPSDNNKLQGRNNLLFKAWKVAEVLNNRVSETVFFNKRNQRAHTDPRLQAVETISTGHVTNIFEIWDEIEIVTVELELSVV